VNRWWTYQRERFPLAAHGPLIAAFSFSAVAYSRLLRSADADAVDAAGAPPLFAALTAFTLSLVFFLQLRIADEFKDFDEDSRFRPYRAVPRGLVSLRELGVLALIAASIQTAAVVAWEPKLLFVLAGVWLYLALMSREFFAREWLKARPITYMWSHMLILPLIDFCATACDWLPHGAAPPPGMFWFLLTGFFNGCVIEIGRKLRSPADEEPGVQTYTVLWGTRGGVAAWWAVLLATAGCAAAAADRIDFMVPTAATSASLLAAAVGVGVAFVRRPDKRWAKWFEPISGVFTLATYLSLGTVPVLL